MQGLKHLVKCRCILPTLKTRADPPLHQFIVFSIVEKDVVLEKIVNCNNCGIAHRIIDICKSVIMDNVESSKSVMTIEDMAIMLPESVSTILQTYEKDLPDYEHAHFILLHEVRGDFIVLSSEIAEEKKLGKVLTYRGEGKFIIEPYSIDGMLK
ncbi:MAG TPA: hypothetical protein EYF95_03470 [Flavobacteriales bacterium]|jgi:hypothetical protein|nr:hypothetical protein [Flavobacteriales bacterium]